MDFYAQKKKTLSGVDKSRKGEIDAGIKEIVGLINSKEDYYTTSSCSGRINIIAKKTGKKFDCDWLFTSHERIDYEQLLPIIMKPSQYKTWFRQEPMILHVCCRTTGSAARLLEIARVVYKRAGIISIKKRIILEIIGSEFMDTIISDDGKMLVPDDYMKVLVEEGNLKMAKNRASLLRFYGELKRGL